jgi:hypothetical protein
MDIEMRLGFDDSDMHSSAASTAPPEQFIVPNVAIRGRGLPLPQLRPNPEDNPENDDSTDAGADGPAQAMDMGGGGAAAPPPQGAAPLRQQAQGGAPAAAAGAGADYRIAPSLLPPSYTAIKGGNCFICGHRSAATMIASLNLEIIRRILQMRVFSECCAAAFDAWNAYVQRASDEVVATWGLVTITHQQGFRHTYICPTEKIIAAARTEELMSANLCERQLTSAIYRLASGPTVFAPESAQILVWQKQLEQEQRQKEKEIEAWRERFTGVVAHLPHG